MSLIAEATAGNYGSTIAHGGGATRWTAPELMDPEDFNCESDRPTTRSDMYSFACICVEVSFSVLHCVPIVTVTDPIS